MAFNQAQNFDIGTLNITQCSHIPLPADPAEILRQARAVEASHISSTAEYAPKCSPEIRQEVIEDVVGWVKIDTTPVSILWLSGPAGAGKTCVMRDVVDRCEVPGLAATSYFFSRSAGLTDERRFVATIVHQIAALDPVLRPFIYDAIRNRPTIFEESLDLQMKKLVVEPMQSPGYWSQSPSPAKIVIAVDGLDECGGERNREHLLNMLRSLVNKLPHLIVVVIASRLEFDLRRAFNDPDVKNITKFLRLQDYDGTKDIRVFLLAELAKIRAHPLGNSIPEGWPLEEIILILLDKSSGNFIYPATVIKYIKYSRRNPIDSLDIILGLAPLPRDSNPFAELDALYSHILHPPETDLALMKRVLHCVLVANDAICLNPIISHFLPELTPSFVDDLLGLQPGTTDATLCDLHSILAISSDKRITFHHRCLEDYLLDPQRSLDSFQSSYKTYLDLTMVCAEHLTRWANNPVADESASVKYSNLCWAGHLARCISHKPALETLPDSILGMDPRIILKYRFVCGITIYHHYDTVQKIVHGALCSEQNCVRLCQLLARIADCVEACVAFGRDFGRDDREGRLEALPALASSSGLDEPLDLNSHTVFNDSSTPEAFCFLGVYHVLHTQPSNNPTPSLAPESPIEQAQLSSPGWSIGIPGRFDGPGNNSLRRQSFEGEASYMRPSSSPPSPPPPSPVLPNSVLSMSSNYSSKRQSSEGGASYMPPPQGPPSPSPPPLPLPPPSPALPNFVSSMSGMDRLKRWLRVGPCCGSE